MNFSSEEFIQKLKNRDENSLTLLINEYHIHLFKGALKQGLGSDQAEEVVQQTWSTFFQKVENFEGRSHIRTYLFGIMYNKIKELWRSNKKYTTEFDDEKIEKVFNENGNFLSSPQSPEKWIESNEFMRILSEELNKLPYNQQMAFRLKEIEGEKSEDICNILGISITNLGVLIYRAKNNLRLKLEQRFSQENELK